MRDFVAAAAGGESPLSSLSRDKEGTDCIAERRTYTQVHLPGEFVVWRGTYMAVLLLLIQSLKKLTVGAKSISTWIRLLIDDDRAGLS